MSTHVPDNDITFVYVKELHESIKSVGGVMQGLTEQIHTHALTLHQLKEQFTTLSKNVDRMMAILYDGHNSKPALTTRTDDLERDIKDIKREREDEKAKAKEERTHGRALGNSIKVAIFVALLSIGISVAGQIITWYTNTKATMSTTPTVGKP